MSLRRSTARAHGHADSRITTRHRRSPARAERGRRQPVRALRPVSGVLPDVRRAGHRDGFAARPHLPHQVARRGAHGAQRPYGRAPLAVSGLPRVRDRVSLRRAVRATDRGRQGGDRATAAGRAQYAGVPLVELRSPARPPAPLGRRRGGAAALPGQRPAGARPALGTRAPAARHAAGVGSAVAPAFRPRPSGSRCRRSRRRGPRRGRVALLTGCVQSVVFGAHNRATARVLARNGWDVVAPAGQGCCGALNAHGGDHARAVAMAKQTIETFEAARADAVIVNTSGCGAHMKAFGSLLANEPAWAARAAAFAATVQDVAEFLAREPLRGPLRAIPMTVTYHDPCHVVHGQKIRRSRARCWPSCPGCAWWTCRSPTGAAARPGSTTSRSRRWPIACCGARRATSNPRGRKPSSPPTPAAFCRSRPGFATATSICPCCTSWRFWIARMAGRGAS